MTQTLHHQDYYRLPWNLADNAITWLEPTTRCNLYCEGCYRENDPEGHKPLAAVIEELETVRRLRRTDGISIAGGEPLIYPHLIELVRYVHAQGWKPIINSNGQALTPELVVQLCDAGAVGFTFHVDSHQVRPGWKGKSEQELNELRLKLAAMVHEAGRGRMACAFNATIYRDTLDDVPMLTRWAQQHSDIVHTMVYILFRSARKRAHYEAFAHGRKVELGDLVYHLENQEHHQDIAAQEVVDRVRTVYPDYAPCAYLNGTEDPASFKWLMGLRFGDKGATLGYADGTFMELVQTTHHLLKGSYLAYTRPSVLRRARLLLPLGLFSRGVRKVAWNLLRSPGRWLAPLHVQSIMIIQPCDILPDGRQNMCDGCPDAIPYEGRMVWSCRVDELAKYGCFVTFGPRAESEEERQEEVPARAGEGE